MNICYLIDVAPGRMNGGGQIHLLNLVREVKSQIPASPAGRSNLKSLPRRQAGQIYGATNVGFLSRVIWMLVVIPQVLFHHFFLRRFDLIHSHSIPAMIPAKVLSLLLGVPVVVTVHGHTLNLKLRAKSEERRAKFISMIEKIVLTKIHYDVQITVSRDFLKIPNVNKKIVYIPNGVDLVRFSSHQSLITNHQSPVILFVGRENDPVKGFSILERAMALVRKKIPSLRLVVADGTVSPVRLPNLYRTSTLLVIPSLSEGFPLTLLEAWASKLPVVSTAVGEIPTLLGVTARSLRNFQSGKLEVYETSRGYVVNPGRTEALAKAILKALENPNLAKMGENGYNLAKRYTWSRVARKTLHVYQLVLNDVPLTNH